MDTWFSLEERFRELAEKEPELFLNFHPIETGQNGWKESEHGWSTPNGEWDWYVSGPEKGRSVEIFEQLIQRAGRLLQELCDFPLQNCTRRFVGIAVEQFGITGLNMPGITREVRRPFKQRPPNCFGNGAEVCSLTAGYLILAEPLDHRRRLVTAAQLADYLQIKAIENTHKKEWPEPAIPAAGSRPAKWEWNQLRPILEQQRPSVDWDTF